MIVEDNSLAPEVFVCRTHGGAHAIVNAMRTRRVLEGLVNLCMPLILLPAGIGAVMILSAQSTKRALNGIVFVAKQGNV